MHASNLSKKFWQNSMKHKLFFCLFWSINHELNTLQKCTVPHWKHFFIICKHLNRYLLGSMSSFFAARIKNACVKFYYSVSMYTKTDKRESLNSYADITCLCLCKFNLSVPIILGWAATNKQIGVSLMNDFPKAGTVLSSLCSNLSSSSFSLLSFFSFKRWH